MAGSLSDEPKSDGLNIKRTEEEGVGTINFVPNDITVDETPTIEIPEVGISDDEIAEGIDEEVPEDISVEDFQALLNSAINIPGLYFGTWWIRTPEQTNMFAKELYIYCEKKGINVREYMFDELPLVLVGAQLAGGIYSDYKAQRPNKTPINKIDEQRLPGEREIVKEEDE